MNYTVQKGDDIYRLARRFGSTPTLIIQANALSDPDVLKVGQTLRIPVTGQSTKEAPAT